MPLTRTSRTDRRRRTMREAVAADSGVAIETMRARSKRRAERDAEEGIASTGLRDQGYSQEVRFACQQRLVQLIPVRKSAMAMVAGALVLVWAILFLLHYLIHVQHLFLSDLPISYYFHMRSPQSFSHWLGCQFWFLTGLTSLLILQLRRHKLDDYRAKYRIWIVLAVAAFASSFEASTSALYTLGQTIDPWTSTEFGYSGWAVVLSSFATVLGVLGLRLCTELKSSPGSVTLWLGGLLAWAFSAVAGTGLFKLDWQPEFVHLAVGGTWLGGIFSVFLASTLYLRHTYIAAQRRFALRNNWLSKQRSLRVGELKDMLKPSAMVGKLKSRFGKDKELEDLEPRRTTKSRTSQGDVSADLESNDEIPTVDATQSASPIKSKLLRWPKLKNASTQSEDFSDLGDEHRKRDEGFLGGFEKVTAESKQSAATSERRSEANEPSANDLNSALKKSRFWSPKKSVDIQSDAKLDNKESSNDVKEKSGWFNRGEKKVKTPKIKVVKQKPAIAADPSDTSVKSKKAWFKKSSKSDAAKIEVAKKPAINPASNDASTSKTKSKFRPFGFMDKLVLKPPTQPTSTASNSIAASTAAPANIPSTAANTHSETRQSSSTNAAPVRPTAEPRNDRAREQIKHAVQGDLDEIDAADDYRNLSKAERKRLRRQQNQDRAA